MNSKIVEMLHLNMEPVGIFFGNTEAKSEMEASPDRRNCVVPFILAAAKGKITSLTEAGYFVFAACFASLIWRRFLTSSLIGWISPALVRASLVSAGPISS